MSVSTISPLQHALFEEQAANQQTSLMAGLVQKHQTATQSEESRFYIYNKIVNGSY
jgi:hypothetical protein